MTDTERDGPAPAIDPRLWMLVSPALPVGGYSYSQGLEQAIAAGWINAAADVSAWISGLLNTVLVPVDLAHLLRIHRSIGLADRNATRAWNAALLAWRETAEARKEDRDMGRALVRLIDELSLADATRLPDPPAFATAFALAGHAFGLTAATLLAAYAWVWCENQVAAAIKLVPLGQTAGQRLLLELAGEIGAVVARASEIDDRELGATATGLAIASGAHETQPTRLFRS